MNRKIDIKLTDEHTTGKFIVTSGINAGAEYTIREGDTVTLGASIDSDIVVHSSSVEQWLASIENRSGVLFLTVIEGTILRDGELLEAAVPVQIDERNIFVVGDTEFRGAYERNLILSGKLGKIHQSPNEDSKSSSRIGPLVPGPGPLNPGQLRKGIDEKRNSVRSGVKYLLLGFSILCVAVGTLSAIYALTGSVIMVNAAPGPSYSAFEEKIEALDLDTFNFARDGDKYLITGMVDTREQKNQLLGIASETDTVVTLDLQVNDELIESIEDIYRVNGIKAKAQVLEPGRVRVNTKTNDVDKLDLVELSATQDIPSLQQLEVINEPPGTIMEPAKPVRQDPDKRVTLIAAGTNAYIMTQDQSRYFVGALLPSGHLVESIENGIVIVSRGGMKETLKY